MSSFLACNDVPFFEVGHPASSTWLNQMFQFVRPFLFQFLIDSFTVFFYALIPEFFRRNFTLIYIEKNIKVNWRLIYSSLPKI